MTTTDIEKAPIATTPTAPKPVATVNVHEAKTHFSRLLAEVEAGGEVIISRAGTPVARLVPLVGAPKPKRQPGTLKGKIGWDDAFFDPLPEDELRLWEGRGDEG